MNKIWERKSFDKIWVSLFLSSEHCLRICNKKYFLVSNHFTQNQTGPCLSNMKFYDVCINFSYSFYKKKVENINRKFFWMNDPVWMIELNQEVQHHYGDQGHSLDHPQCSDKSQNLGFLRKSFFGFWGAPINFLTPKNLIWP